MKSTSKSSSEFDTRWALAASVDSAFFEDLATQLLDRKRWTVLEGERGFSALAVGDNDPAPQLAAVFMARNDCAVYLLDFDDEAPSVVEFDQGKNNKHRGHPAAFLKDHGIVAPGNEPPPPSPVQSVLVVEGVSPRQP